MKLLIVSQYFWPESFLVNSLATELKKRGHEVTVLTGLPNYPSGQFFPGYNFWKGPWEENYQGVKVLRVPLVPRKKGFLNLAINYLSFIIFGIFPGSIRVKKDFDLIFCMGLSPVTICLPAVFLKWISRKPLVFWVQDLWPESVAAVGASKAPWLLNLIGAIVRFIYSQCDLILIQSKAFKESVLRWGGSGKDIRYMPNWFQSAGVIKHVPQWLENIPSGFKIIFAGNIGKAQDMSTIIEAARILEKYSDIHWMIIGDGSEKSYVDEKIISKKLQATVHTYGRRPSEDMPALFSAGDLMLVTLTNEPIFSLTIPSKVQAYMSSARPILAALNGEGARVVVEAGAGLSCPAESPEALAETVLKIYKMTPDQRAQMGLKGIEYFKKHFEQSVVIEQIENVCMELCKN